MDTYSVDYFNMVKECLDDHFLVASTIFCRHSLRKWGFPTACHSGANAARENHKKAQYQLLEILLTCIFIILVDCCVDREGLTGAKGSFAEQAAAISCQSAVLGVLAVENTNISQKIKYGTHKWTQTQ